MYRTSPNVLLSMARHYLAFIFLTVTCIISFFILSTHLFDLHTRVLQLFWTDTNWTEKEIVSRPFVFLTQTEQCLPPKLSDHLKLSTNITCRCDVIVLSYKIKCQKERPPHVTYLFDNTTTWGSGRNKLFFLAMNRRPGYTYFIFTDDDVSLKFNLIPHTKEWAGGLPTNMSVQQWSWNFVDKRCCFFQWPLKTYYIAVIQDRLEEVEKLGNSLFKSSNRGHLPNMWTKVYSTNSGKIHLVT